MAGSYIHDLFQEIVELQGDLNTTLSSNELEELKDVNDQFVKISLKKQPFMLIDMLGKRTLRPNCQEQTYEVVEDIPVSLNIYVRGDQRLAIQYEGVVKRWFKGKETYLRTLITDANLVVIHPMSSEIVINTDTTNGDDWIIKLGFMVKFSWS